MNAKIQSTVLVALSMLGAAPAFAQNAVVLSRFLADPIKEGWPMKFVRIRDEGTEISAQYLVPTSDPNDADEQLSFSVDRIASVDVSMEWLTSGRGSQMGVKHRDIGTYFSAPNIPILTQWPQPGSIGLRVYAFVRDRPDSKEGWEITVDWNMYQQKRVKGRPAGREATRKDLELAVAMILKFIENGKRQGWPSG
jgi:hypothetical protein